MPTITPPIQQRTEGPSQHSKTRKIKCLSIWKEETKTLLYAYNMTVHVGKPNLKSIEINKRAALIIWVGLIYDSISGDS